MALTATAIDHTALSISLTALNNARSAMNNDHAAANIDRSAFITGVQFLSGSEIKRIGGEKKNKA